MFFSNPRFQHTVSNRFADLPKLSKALGKKMPATRVDNHKPGSGQLTRIYNKSSHLDPDAIIDFNHTTRNCLASWWRGGTSKGIFIQQNHLPNFVYPVEFLHLQRRFTVRWEDHVEKLQEFLDPILGSADQFRRQLNGLGGGISSLSKAVLYRKAPPGDKDADVEYTFIQVGVEDGKLDMTGNCGNLTSAVGPIALNEKLYHPPADRFDYNEAVSGGDHTRAIPVTIRLRNTNTRKLIHATFMARLSLYSPAKSWVYQPRGSYSIDGVPGLGSRIGLKFMNPGGSKTGKVLPTGNAVDIIQTNQDSARASLVDITNPGIFVAGADLGWDPSRTPEDLDSNIDLMERLEAIRKKGTEMMGLDPQKFKATPKIVLVYPPDSDDVHIRCQALSMEKAHKAVPGTLALNLGAASKLPGTIPNELARQDPKSAITIGHPSGKAEVGAEIENGKVISVELGRTARCLMEGFVNWFDSERYDTTEISIEEGE